MPSLIESNTSQSRLQQFLFEWIAFSKPASLEETIHRRNFIFPSSVALVRRSPTLTDLTQRLKRSRDQSKTKTQQTKPSRTERPEPTSKERPVFQSLPVQHSTISTFPKPSAVVPFDFIWEPADCETLLKAVFPLTIYRSLGPQDSFVLSDAKLS